MGIFVGLTIDVTELVTSCAVSTGPLVAVEIDHGHTIEQAKQATQGTQHAAPGTFHDKDGRQKHTQYGEFEGIGPDHGRLGQCLLHHVGHSRFQGAGRTDSGP